MSPSLCSRSSGRSSTRRSRPVGVCSSLTTPRRWRNSRFSGDGSRCGNIRWTAWRARRILRRASVSGGCVTAVSFARSKSSGPPKTYKPGSPILAGMSKPTRPSGRSFTDTGRDPCETSDWWCAHGVLPDDLLHDCHGLGTLCRVEDTIDIGWRNPLVGLDVFPCEFLPAGYRALSSFDALPEARGVLTGGQDDDGASPIAPGEIPGSRCFWIPGYPIEHDRVPQAELGFGEVPQNRPPDPSVALVVQRTQCGLDRLTPGQSGHGPIPAHHGGGKPRRGEFRERGLSRPRRAREQRDGRRRRFARMHPGESYEGCCLRRLLVPVGHSARSLGALMRASAPGGQITLKTRRMRSGVRPCVRVRPSPTMYPTSSCPGPKATPRADRYVCWRRA